MISLQNLTKAYNATHPLFQNLNFEFPSEHILAIVGPNGVGKTTLARIIAGKTRPTSGNIKTDKTMQNMRGAAGNCGKIGYIPQELKFSSSVTIKGYLKNFVQPWEDYKISDALSQVGFPSNISLKRRLTELSGGQQRRVLFAQMLLQDCEILILDEPTNHIDTETRERFVNYIQSFSGQILMISHDRALINEVCDGVIDMEFGTLTYYPADYRGAYEAFKQDKQSNKEKKKAEAERYERNKRKMEDWLRRLQERASYYANPTFGKLLKAKKSRFGREFGGPDPEKVRFTKSAKLHLDGGVHNSKRLFRYVKKDISIAGNLLIKDCSFEMFGKERVLLQGINGSGKTTLLRDIVSQFTHNDDSVVTIGNGIKHCYIDQYQLNINSDLSVINEFFSKVEGVYRDQIRAKTVLSGFGLGEKQRDQKVSTLSYGQKVRLRFAEISGYNYDLLILDEPTNHLDIDTREVIESALMDYEGALLIVSHDQYFVQEIMIDRIVEIIDERLVER
ncbi:ABC transporter ATP-binding protein [candidate division SR1 bacterium]|nr:ABC transporter ATP-binding protein [candidate division SR1 bacterium]